MESWIPAMNQRTTVGKPLNDMLKFISWIFLGCLYVQKSAPLTNVKLSEFSLTDHWTISQIKYQSIKPHPKASDDLASNTITVQTSDHMCELRLFVLYINRIRPLGLAFFTPHDVCKSYPYCCCVFHSAGCVSVLFPWMNFFFFYNFNNYGFICFESSKEIQPEH